MTILVLGGNGYLGSKVTRRLVESGHIVICTKRATSDISRLIDLNSKIEWVEASVSEIETVLQKSHFDYVLNLSCNYGRSKDSDNDVIEANLVFPLAVLISAINHGTKRFLTIGTGLPEKLNMYSFSKKRFSDFGKFYSIRKGITFHSVLLEMFYGSDEPVNRFLPSVVRKMINGELVETTKGTQHRDLICVDDVVDAIMMIVNSDLNGFNEIPVGTGESPLLSDVIDYIWDETGRRSEVQKGTIPMRDNEPDCVADVSILKRLGEWNPMPWKLGLKKMIDEMEGIE